MLIWYLLGIWLLRFGSAFHCPRRTPPKLVAEYFESADVVVSATVDGVRYEEEEATASSHLLIHRIFKGAAALHDAGHQMVAQLRPQHRRQLDKDTRVFFLGGNESEHFVRATLPITLKILDTLHSIVTRRAVHRKKHSLRKLPCERKTCPFGSKCVLSTGKCECRTFCHERFFAPVCGSDRQTYASLCHLSVRACLLRPSGTVLRVAHLGACETKNLCDDLRCGPGEDCVIEEKNGILSAHCVCPQSCPNYGDSVESSPVCSVHGKDYKSVCHLKQDACLSNLNITVKYYGRCDPCNGHLCPPETVCRLGPHRRPQCRCSQQCPLNREPVCASDGKTYENECVMKVAGCREGQELTAWKRGTCEENGSPCSAVACAPGSHCRVLASGVAKCDCVSACAQVDGRTYSNECEMKKAACETQTRLYVRHSGTCGVGVCATYKECAAPQVCVPRDGRPSCGCPACGDELMEVCGSDGLTYANECRLRQAACRARPGLFVKYAGICEGCEKLREKCAFYSVCVARGHGVGECECPMDCPLNGTDAAKPSTVCGTDGVTYSSECHLRRSACQRKTFVVVAFAGKCDACQHMECGYGEECRGGVCSCNYQCESSPSETSRVCGEDGMLYASVCHLQLAACRKGGPIMAVDLSKCHASAQVQDECLCNRVGSYSSTCDVAGRCRCRPGVAGAKCDHCVPGFFGIHLIARGALSCTPCGCSAFGSARTDCEQSSGQCECLPHALGQKCDKCEDGLLLTAQGCIRPHEFEAPRTCGAHRCLHGASCVAVRGELPSCRCETTCAAGKYGIAANMSICGSDGQTYESLCQLRQFACKHQIDLVPVSLGICEAEIANAPQLDRAQRQKTPAPAPGLDLPNLGTRCSSHAECAPLLARCRARPGRPSRCECDEDARWNGRLCVETERQLPPLNIQCDGRQKIKVRDVGDLTASFNFTLKVTPAASNGTLLDVLLGLGRGYKLRIERRRVLLEYVYPSMNTRTRMSVTQKNVANATRATMNTETWWPNDSAASSSMQHGSQEQSSGRPTSASYSLPVNSEILESFRVDDCLKAPFQLVRT